jgi:2-keto-3-deoxy-L-rhamnonate aldolase RhmA
MQGRELRRKLRCGERVYGSLVIAVSPAWPGVAKAAGMDFVFIDTEHVPLDRAQLSWMCHAFEANSVVPVVRVSDPDPYKASKMLDGGARGIITPYIETPEQLANMIGAIKYRPIKGAKLDAALSGTTPLDPDLRAYVDDFNIDNIAIANIESVSALEALDEILDVDGLDAVLIGPHDLSVSLGVPEQYENPKYIDAVDTIITKARAKGVGAGNHFAYTDVFEHEVRWGQMGANLIVHAADVIVFRNGMRDDLNRIKAALGDLESNPDQELENINI